MQSIRLKGWLPPVLFLALTIGILGPGGYFLHHDTPLQNAGGADLVLGCWGPDGGKAAVMLLEGIAYLIGGVNPAWDMVNLAVFGAVMAFAFFRLTRNALGSTSWALLGVLWVLSLPSVLYYSHIHMGYPLAFFVLGMWLYSEKRYVYAGAALCLAILSHSSFMIPVGLWCLTGVILVPGEERLKMSGKLIGGFFIPYLPIEALRFLFTGVPFGWTRIIMGDIFRQAVFENTLCWSHIFELLAFSNTWINAILLVIGVSYPLFRRVYRHPLMDQVYLTGWLMIAFYVYRVIIQGMVLPRMLTAAYVLLAVPSLYVGMCLVKKMGGYRRVALAVLSLVVSWSLLQHVVDFAVFSRTGFEAVDQAMAQAAEAGMPVRYFGNMNAGLYFGLRREVMVNVNEQNLDIITGDTHAVLIFERVPNADLLFSMRCWRMGLTVIMRSSPIRIW